MPRKPKPAKKPPKKARKPPRTPRKRFTASQHADHVEYAVQRLRVRYYRWEVVRDLRRKFDLEERQAQRVLDEAQKAKDDQLGHGTPGQAPPEFREAYKEFTERLSGLDRARREKK